MRLFQSLNPDPKLLAELYPTQLDPPMALPIEPFIDFTFQSCKLPTVSNTIISETIIPATTNHVVEDNKVTSILEGKVEGPGPRPQPPVHTKPLHKSMNIRWSTPLVDNGL